MPLLPVTEMQVSYVPTIRGDKISLKTDYRDYFPVNMFGVRRPISGAAGYTLCYPGLTKVGGVAAIGVNADRGGLYNDRQGIHYRVSGDKLISLNAILGTTTELGTIPGISQAAMPYSFTTQAIIADGRMFLYDGGTFSEIDDDDLGNPLDGVWIDGYYFLTDGEYIYHTDIDDETAIDPLKYATAEFMPDSTLGVGKTSDNKVMVFGRYTIEYFQDAATVNFAFQRITPRAQKIGIVATHAKCEVGDKWYIVGGRKGEAVSVHIIAGGASIKVATREVDKLIAKYTETELADIRVESYMQDDDTFILIHLPEETLCYSEDVAKGLGVENAWILLKSGITGMSNYRAINGVFDPTISKWVYGDKRNGNIGYLDNEVFTQYEERQEWLLYTPFIQLERQSINEIELETIPGSSVVDDDATVAVSVTYDGIHYGREWFQLYGAALDYNQRFIIRRFGYVSSWIGFKFRGATRSRMSFAILKVTHG